MNLVAKIAYFLFLIMAGFFVAGGRVDLATFYLVLALFIAPGDTNESS